MKFTIHFKTPGAVDYAIRDIIQAEFGRDCWANEDLPQDLDHPFWDKVVMQKTREDELEEFVARWVKHGEAVSIEFDMEAGTATVLER